jgi:hypothetical protein
MKLGIRFSFVKTLEFRRGGLNPPPQTTHRYVTASHTTNIPLCVVYIKWFICVF